MIHSTSTAQQHLSSITEDSTAIHVNQPSVLDKKPERDMFGIPMFDTQLLESEAHRDAFTLPAPFFLPTLQAGGRK